MTTFKYGSTLDAYRAARRAITNNALRRKQKSLDLSGLGLEEIPPEVGLLAQLETLDVSNNLLSSLPEAFARLTSLRHLNLAKNKFIAVPEEIKALVSLRVLKLNNNGISQLSEVSSLTHLVRLKLDYNAIHQVDFSEVPRTVAVLELDSNHLTAIDKTISSLPNLLALDVADNGLTTVSEEIGTLRKLRALHLEGNHLSSLPQSLGDLQSLVEAAQKDHKPYVDGLFLNNNPLNSPLIELSSVEQPFATSNVVKFFNGSLDPVNMEGQRVFDFDPKTIEIAAIPTQTFGPHFDLDETEVITFAQPRDLDAQGNNVKRLRQLKPFLQQISEELADILGLGNIPHFHLRDRISAYAAMTAQDLTAIDFSLLYVEGVRVANAYAASLADRELPSLDAHVKERVDTLIQVHGSFVLATADGIELVAAEERYQRNAAEEFAYRQAAVELAEMLQAQVDVISPQAATFVLDVAKEIGVGPNPERSSVVAVGALKNIVITVAATASLGALAAAATSSGSPVVVAGAAAAGLMTTEGLKKSKPFAVAIELITRGFDVLGQSNAREILSPLLSRLAPHVRFVLNFESSLRKLAGSRDELSWLNASLDWIRKHSS